MQAEAARSLLSQLESRAGTGVLAGAAAHSTVASCISEVAVPTEHEEALQSGAIFLELDSSRVGSPLAGVAQAAAAEVRRVEKQPDERGAGAPRLQQLRSGFAAVAKAGEDPPSPGLAPSPSATASPLPPSGLPSDLDCRCQPSACKCDKQCFCRVRTDAFEGNRLEPPSGLSALADMPPDHDCACSMGDVGGPGFDSLNTVDCDCLVAACACARKCTCSQKAATASPSPSVSGAGTEEGK